MDIDVNTARRTLAELKKNGETELAAMRRDLRKIAEEESPVTKLTYAVNGIAEAEGYLSTITRLEEIAEKNPRRLTHAAIQIVTQTPGDTFSGRANDVRRAHGDGVKKALQDLRTHILRL